MSMDRTFAFCMAVYVGLSVLTQPSIVLPRTVNKEALVARINRVVVLDFETDRPVREARALVDGKVIDRSTWPGTSKGIQLAVIRHSDDVLVEMQVDGIGGTMEFPFPMNFRAEVGEPESYGPGRHLVLNDWVEVFSVTQMKFFKDVVAKFQIEVR